MSVLYGKFEMPERIVIDDKRGNTFCRFIAEPFEPGFGHTLGNSLRRMLLSSIEAPGIVSVAIEGIPHEYMAVDGIIEDMINIVLNFKGALLRKIPREDQVGARDMRTLTHILNISGEDLASAGGQVTVKLGDVFPDGEFEVINPELELFRVTKPMTRRIDIRVGFGRGYVSAENHVLDERVEGEIVVDTAFSPVRLVNYYIENTRVGQNTDFNRLILEITTDGRITPEEALSHAVQILIKHFDVFNKAHKHQLVFQNNEISEDTDREEILQKLCLRIGEIELSVRSANCLSGADIEFIGELVVRPESEMLKFRNFGKKSLNEIKAKLHEMGLSLGMELSKHGITRENVRQVIVDHLQQNQGTEE